MSGWGKVMHCEGREGAFSFFPCTARLWNSLPIECFPLAYDLNDFKPGHRFVLNRKTVLSNHVCFNLFLFCFRVTPCHSGCSALHGMNPK